MAAVNESTTDVDAEDTADAGNAGDDNSKTYIEYVKGEFSKQSRWTRSDDIEACIKRCARALAHGDDRHLLYIAIELEETLTPMLFEQASKEPWELHAEMEGHEWWHYDAMQEFADHSETYIDVLSRSVHDGAVSPSQSTTRIGHIIEQAFESCAAIAETKAHIQQELRNRVDALGWATKLGEHLQDEQMDLGDTVKAVSDQADYLKSLHCGPTGLGKSTGAEREAEDYLQLSFQEGRDCKVIDMIGFRQGESWLPDVPQQQDKLREALEEQDLAPDFTEAEELGRPEAEILVPLTDDVPNKPFPFRVDDEVFVAKPFTVPASEIRKPVLVSLIMSRLSEGEENTIREAYDAVEKDITDWSLADLADEIRHRDELSDKHRTKAINVLRSLQNEGFIRTKADDRTLDWTDIFHDTTTRTIFSQARCSELAGLITFAYQADAIFQKRKSMHAPPDCALLFRELWEVVPHKRRRSFDSRQAAVQEAIGQIMMRLMRQNRHVRCHLIADTQEPNDLLKSIREMFNRYVVYGANRDTIKDIFSWTQNDRWKAFWATMTPQAGEAGIVGQVQPAIDNRHIEFLSPVSMAPPMHHHFDVKQDGTGWHARVEYSQKLDCMAEEELRRPIEVGGDCWDTSRPDELEVEPYANSVEEEGPNPEIQPLQAFEEECLTQASGVVTIKQRVYDAFNGYVTEYGHEPWDFDDRGTTSRFGQKLDPGFPISVTNKDNKAAYSGLALTAEGEEMLERWRGDDSIV